MSDLKVKDALELYFKKYQFTNGAYDDKFFGIKIGPVFIPVPNTKARITAVKIHDIHHLLTEYTAFIRGRSVKASLYRNIEYNEALLNASLCDL